MPLLRSCRPSPAAFAAASKNRRGAKYAAVIRSTKDNTTAGVLVHFHKSAKIAAKRSVVDLHFPLVLELLLISEWLDINTCMNLDSALTNHALRDAFLALLALAPPHKQLAGRIVNTGELFWLALRECKVTDLTCSRNISPLAVLSIAYSPGFASLSYLNLIGCTADLNDALIEVFPYVNQLSHINLSNNCINDHTISMLTVHCRFLESIILAGCDKLSDSAVLAIAANCHLLQYLNIARCNKITDASISATAEGCRSLEVINLSNCHLVTDASVKALASNSTKLNMCDFSYCNITDQSLHALANARTDSIYYLSLIDTFVTDAGMIPLLKQHGQFIWHLDLSLCDNITDITLQAITTYCSVMKELKLNHCTLHDSSCKQLLKTSKCLRVLELHGSTVHVKNIIRYALKYSPQLQQLDVSTCLPNLYGQDKVELHVYRSYPKYNSSSGEWNKPLKLTCNAQDISTCWVIVHAAVSSLSSPPSTPTSPSP